MAEIQHPTFDPAYVPMPGKRDSISVRCLDEDTMFVWNNRWDEGTSWMAVKDTTTGEWVVPEQEWHFGEGHELPHRPGFVLYYWSGEVYTYGIVPGQCRVETTTTTTNPPSTTTTVPEPTTTTSLEGPTTTTTEPEPVTTTTAPVETTTTLPLVTLPTVPVETTVTVAGVQTGVCEYDSNLNQWRNSATGQFMSTAECSTGTLQPVGIDTTNARSQHPSTGADPLTSVLLGSVLVLTGFVASAPAIFNRWRKRTLSRNT